MAGKSDKPADKPEEKKPYTIIDVNHPGKTAADATGVPVIVTNRPVLKDPMVVDKEEKVETDTAEKNAIIDHSKKIKIQPLDEADKAKEAEKDSDKTIAEIAVEADAKAEDKPAKADKTATKEEVKEPQPEPEKDKPATKEADEKAPEPEAPKPTEEEAKADDVSGELTEETDPKAAEEARKAAEKKLALDKLAESGTYALPINAVEKRRVKRFAIITVALLVILGLAWVDLAMDAQLIQINGVNAPTDFFPDR